MTTDDIFTNKDSAFQNILTLTKTKYHDRNGAIWYFRKFNKIS